MPIELWKKNMERKKNYGKNLPPIALRLFFFHPIKSGEKKQFFSHNSVGCCTHTKVPCFVSKKKTEKKTSCQVCTPSSCPMPKFETPTALQRPSSRSFKSKDQTSLKQMSSTNLPTESHFHRNLVALIIICQFVNV